MQELKCPNCGEVFQVDESGYAQIVSQIRDKEFETELKRREEELNKNRERDLELVRLEQEKKQEAVLNKKNSELSEKDKEILELKTKLTNAESEKKIAVMEAVAEKEKEVTAKNNVINELNGKLSLSEKETELNIKTLKESYETKLKDKDEQIEYYKDFKARQSTKMIGESLEQHCLNEFNTIRMTAFPTAYFEKDNDAKTGSKGDFIFRENTEDGIELVSIMFEMKNEADETKTKHKNEDFFKELDKDRREKNCEYAVLVSTLEMDNEYYNTGIVDVSYKYPKMYVIRPQLFIPMITLIRNASLNSLQYKREIKVMKEEQLDIFNFQENLEAFKTGFNKNFKDASERFQDAINGIDKTIDQLEKIKKALLTSEKHLNAANNKIEDVTIKKLTKNAPSVRAMLEEKNNEV
ncbi:MAG: DUF2130 domain-containing protein [Ruminococcaceae bacterium]|nr:DUF2130 domain-containing protein [Oscillospiraceae bacterium]